MLYEEISYCKKFAKREKCARADVTYLSLIVRFVRENVLSLDASSIRYILN